MTAESGGDRQVILCQQLGYEPQGDRGERRRNGRYPGREVGHHQLAGHGRSAPRDPDEVLPGLITALGNTH